MNREQTEKGDKGNGVAHAQNLSAAATFISIALVECSNGGISYVVTQCGFCNR